MPDTWMRWSHTAQPICEISDTRQKTVPPSSDVLFSPVTPLSAVTDLPDSPGSDKSVPSPCSETQSVKDHCHMPCLRSHKGLWFADVPDLLQESAGWLTWELPEFLPNSCLLQFFQFSPAGGVTGILIG